MRTREQRITLVWLALVTLTLGSAWLGEEGWPAPATALLVALIVAVKGLPGGSHGAIPIIEKVIHDKGEVDE